MPLLNPPLAQFLEQLGEEQVLAQVLIRRLPPGLELRHMADRNRPAESLRTIELAGLRTLAQHTAEGLFRPLTAAPNLASGWRTPLRNDEELGRALDQLYPGALADWFAARQENPAITHFREFTARQSGMYRITAMLEETHAADMIAACCHADSCLKRRLWTAPGAAADPVEGKSAIPCLEPCAVLLEFARLAARLAQGEQAGPALAPGEIDTLRAALRHALTQPARMREADFSAPLNPRRVRLLLERLSEAEK